MSRISLVLKQRKGAAKAAIIAVLLACAPIGAQSASAASVYDNAIQQIDTLEVGGINPNTITCEAEDISTTWGSIIATDSTAGQSFQTALGTGQWIATEKIIDNYYGTSEWQPVIYWVETGTIDVTFINLFNNYYGTQISSTSTIHSAIIKSNFAGHLSSQPSCNYGIYVYNANVDNGTILTDNYTQSEAGYIKRAFLVNANVIYPEGYEGQHIRKDFIIKKKNQPKADISVNDRDIMLGFNPEELPIKEAGISVTVTDPTGKKIIDNDSMNNYNGWVKQFNVNDYGLYHVHAEYYIPIPFIMPENIEPIPLDIDVNVNGDLFMFHTKEACNQETGVCGTANVIKPCITTTAPDGTGDQIAPYLNIPNCAQNVFSAMHLLAFKTVKIGNAFTNPNECTTLGTIGDWLKLENKTVCANFPSSIRNVITPFIVFALSLMAIRGLTKPRFTT